MAAKAVTTKISFENVLLSFQLALCAVALLYIFFRVMAALVREKGFSFVKACLVNAIKMSTQNLRDKHTQGAGLFSNYITRVRYCQS